MEVSGPGSVGGGSPIRPTELRPTQDVTATAPGLTMPQDEVHISDAARMLERLSHDPSIRADRLAQIQAEIASGTYETTDKLEMAVERLLREIR